VVAHDYCAVDEVPPSYEADLRSRVGSLAVVDETAALRGGLRDESILVVVDEKGVGDCILMLVV